MCAFPAVTTSGHRGHCSATDMQDTNKSGSVANLCDIIEYTDKIISPQASTGFVGLKGSSGALDQVLGFFRDLDLPVDERPWSAKRLSL